MRTTLLLLVAALLSSAPVYAQTETKSAAAPATTLTEQERTKAVDYLKETQKDFLAAIDGLSEAQWKYKPSPEKWSIAETAEHIGAAEDLIWKNVSEKIMKSPATPEKRAEVQGKEDMILKVIPDRSRKATAPEQLNPTGRWAGRAELAKDFEAMRAKEIAYLKETKEDLRSHFGDHPFLKTMDAYQWLVFNGAHCKRHTAQILEVKADPNFPKN